MLEMIKQLMPLQTPQEVARTMAGGQIGQQNQTFGKMLQMPTQPAPARTEGPRAERPDDRSELGSGWETADEGGYDVAAAAETKARPQEAPEVRSDAGQGDASDKASRAEGGSGDSSNDVQAAQGDSDAKGRQQDAAGEEAQAAAEVAEAAMAAGKAGTIQVNQQTAVDAAAPETAGGTQTHTSTDAGDAAVLPMKSLASETTEGPQIQQQLAGAGEVAAKEAKTTDGDADADQQQQDQTHRQDLEIEIQGRGKSKDAQQQEAKASFRTVERTGPAEAAGGDTAAGPAEANAAATVETGPTFAVTPETATFESSAATANVSAGVEVAALGPDPSGALSQASTSAPIAPGAESAAMAAEALPEPDVEQLAVRAVRWQRLGVLQGEGSARIRLAPPELGTVEIQMRSSGNQLTLQMTVDSEPVRQLLQSQSDRLIQSLNAHGLQAQRVQIEVSNPGESAPEQEANQQNSQGQPDTGGRQDGQDRPGQQGGPFAEQMQEELNVTA